MWSLVIANFAECSDVIVNAAYVRSFTQERSRERKRYRSIDLPRFPNTIVRYRAGRKLRAWRGGKKNIVILVYLQWRIITRCGRSQDVRRWILAARRVPRGRRSPSLTRAPFCLRRESVTFLLLDFLSWSLRSSLGKIRDAESTRTGRNFSAVCEGFCAAARSISARSRKTHGSPLRCV